METPHLAKADPEGSKDHENLHVQEVNCFPAKGVADKMEEDKVIKALLMTFSYIHYFLMLCFFLSTER